MLLDQQCARIYFGFSVWI